MSADIKHLISLRQSLHQNPELSGCEEFTAEALKRSIIKFQPDDIIDNLGGYGVAFVFKGKKEGSTLMFRADMDALPIHENNTIDYASRTDGVAHQCGHDGHMAILVGLAERISKNRPQKGKVVLLFQPAEETGDGALAVIKDPNFYRIEPDMCFSLHNIPGYPKGSIILKSNTFTAASQGINVKLFGKTSHAAEPLKGISPSIAMAQLMEYVEQLPKMKELFFDFVLATVVHARLGERTYGVSPGFAEILITMRSYEDADMETLIEQTKLKVHEICAAEKLAFEIGFTDIYPSTQNDQALTTILNERAEALNLEIVNLEKPFPWAEDFAQFSKRYRSAIFGLGAGENSPKLHNGDYNFPDEIIPTGIDMYHSVYEYFLLK